jgi:NAD(P)-dependent dehydrogenase (short-subunit alcohol dehydrogenase family)
MQIEDGVFIVTGAASGLGAATARMLAQAGGRVVLADVQEAAGTQLAGELADGGTGDVGRARFVRCDVTSEADGQAVVAAALALGQVRGLVNCAGIAPAAKTVGKDGPHPLDAFRRAVEINLIGTFNMCRLAAQAMAAQAPLDGGESGVIVNTASVAAFDGQIGQAAYAASKAGVAGMTLPMARDLARSGIRVMTIAPGIFETPMLMGMPQDVRDSLGQMVPFPPRLGRAHEYAQLVRAIVENPMLNGETIRLDGAIRMGPK